MIQTTGETDEDDMIYKLSYRSRDVPRAWIIFGVGLTFGASITALIAWSFR